MHLQSTGFRLAMLIDAGKSIVGFQLAGPSGSAAADFCHHLHNTLHERKSSVAVRKDSIIFAGIFSGLSNCTLTLPIPLEYAGELAELLARDERTDCLRVTEDPFVPSKTSVRVCLAGVLHPHVEELQLTQQA